MLDGIKGKVQIPDSNGQPRLFRRGSFNGSLNSWLRVLLLIIAATIVLVIAWTAIGTIAHIVFLFFASLLFAYLIGPIVDRWGRRMHRGAATGLVFLIVLPLAGLLLLIFIGPIISELGALVNAISNPSTEQTAVITRLAAFLNEHDIPVDLNNLDSQLAGLIKDSSDVMLKFIVGAASHLISFVVDTLMVLAITFFLSVDGRGINVRILRLMTDSFREHVLFLEATVSRVIGGYIRAQIIIATLYALLAGGGSWLLGVNYALFIGIAAFFLEFLPLVGPVISMGIAIVISLFQPLPLVVWVTLYFIFIQQLESNVLEPKIGGRILGLHAVVVIIAVLAGAALAGILGAFLALPLVAAATTLGLALYLDIRGRTNLLISLHPSPSMNGDAPMISEAIVQKPDISAIALPAAGQATTAQAVAVAPTHTEVQDIMEGAPPAALMFKDRLDFVLEEQARLRASYEEISARQSAVERRAHGLEPIAGRISP